VIWKIRYFLRIFGILFLPINLIDPYMSKFTFTTISKGLLAVAAVCGFSFASQAQIFFNKGAMIYTAPQSIVHINGGIENDNGISTGNMDHNGTMTVTLNSANPNPGDVMLSSGTSLWQGDGLIRLEGDWVNNAIFQQDLSEVEMYASTVQQQITGTVVTTFHDLTLTGTGTGANRIKLMTLDANIDQTGTLDLNDRELATDINTMFVLNPSVSAIDNDSTIAGSEGFVSSVGPNGYLSRVTNSQGSYNYPVGSSVVLQRYRPVRIAPNSTTSATYVVRFINHDADVDGFLRSQNDSTMCLTIDTFYHAINRTASAVGADIRIYYKPATDNNWGGMAHWRTTNNQWNDMATVSMGTSINGFTTMTRGAWQFTNPGFPYLLTQMRSAAPTITCPTICENGDGTFTVTGGGGNYVWTTPNGTIINSGQGTDTINVSWGNQTGVVYVVDTTNGSACASLPDSCVITPMPAPVAGFDTVSFGNFNTTYQFADSSTGGTSWFWDFGDGSTSTLQNPSHQYNGAGTYTVMQVVTSASGCIDTIFITVVVGEGILIPNVFTPDGDGINDEFWIPSSGFESFEIEIYNRWGTKIWEASAGEIRWDGHSTSGQMMSDGTYYFILNAMLKSQSGPKDYSTKGYVTLLSRGKK
jgi:gliding motility-associated-like protein